MYKAILASVILGSMSVASAAEVNWSGDFGYRNDSLEVGNANSDRDRFRAGLVAKADVNDKTKCSCKKCKSNTWQNESAMGYGRSYV